MTRRTGRNRAEESLMRPSDDKMIKSYDGERKTRSKMTMMLCGGREYDQEDRQEVDRSKSCFLC